MLNSFFLSIIKNFLALAPKTFLAKRRHLSLRERPIPNYRFALLPAYGRKCLRFAKKVNYFLLRKKKNRIIWKENRFLRSKAPFSCFARKKFAYASSLNFLEKLFKFAILSFCTFFFCPTLR